MGRSHGWGRRQPAGRRAQRGGCKQRRRERRYLGAQEGPLTCFLSPQPRAGSSRGAGGVPAGGEPTSPEQACMPLGGCLGGLFPNTGISLPPSLLLPVPPPTSNPPKQSCWRFPLGCIAGARSSLITKQNYFKVPCLPGPAVGTK